MPLQPGTRLGPYAIHRPDRRGRDGRSCGVPVERSIQVTNPALGLSECCVLMTRLASGGEGDVYFATPVGRNEQSKFIGSENGWSNCYRRVVREFHDSPAKHLGRAIMRNTLRSSLLVGCWPVSRFNPAVRASRKRLVRRRRSHDQGDRNSVALDESPFLPEGRCEG